MVPDFVFALKDTAIYLQKLGRHNEAIMALREFQERLPNITLDLLAGMHKRGVLAPDIAARPRQWQRHDGNADGAAQAGSSR